VFSTGVVWQGPCHEIDYLLSMEIDDPEMRRRFDFKGVAMGCRHDMLSNLGPWLDDQECPPIASGFWSVPSAGLGNFTD
jgi:hypothetical protein